MKLWIDKLILKYIAQVLDVIRNTVKTIIKRIGNMAIYRYYADFKRIGGPFIVEETIESKFSKIKCYRD